MDYREQSNEHIVACIQKADGPSCGLFSQLWDQNQGLIKIYVKRYSNRAECEDLWQEAYIALCMAVDHYQHGSSAFSSYLGYWLQSRLNRYCEKNATLPHVPANTYFLLARMKRLSSDFAQNFHREPTERELRDLMGVSLNEIRRLSLLDLARTCTSLYSPLSVEDGENITLADVLPSDEDIEADVVDSILQSEMREAIDQELAKLPDPQGRLIHLVYLDRMSREKAAEIMHLTLSQIGTLLKKGFRTLRIKSSKQLKPFICDEALAIAYHGTLGNYKLTRTSSTERAAIRDLEQTKNLLQGHDQICPRKEGKL